MSPHELVPRTTRWLEFPEYGGGLPLRIPYWIRVGLADGPKALLIAGVHGDEFEGVAALQDLARVLDPAGLKGILTIVPVANPLAFHAGTRRSPADLADLNRSFPGEPDGTISARLAYRLFHEVVLGNDILLSLHGWSSHSVVVPYAEYPLGNSEAAQRSCAAAHALGMEYLHPYEWPKGVLGEAALKHGVAAVETEVGGMGTVTSEGQQETMRLIHRFLAHLGMLEPDRAASPAQTTKSKIVDHVDCVANHAGLFRSRVHLGETVQAGAVLGTVHGLGGECLEEVQAPRRSMLAILRRMASVQPGDRLAQLFCWGSIE